MKISKLSFFGLMLGTLMWVNTAAADGWPISVLGTWSVNANNSTGSLVITTQGTTGLCRPIGGTIFGNPIQGFYCPFSGRITFLRKIAATNDTFQVYSANLGQVFGGLPLRMGGTFSSMNATFGEYNFFASK